jgi:large subunit ribosomal protein L22
MDLVRGRGCDEALEILNFMPHRGARFIAKVLRSAIANAEENEADVGSLYVSEAKVDMGPHRMWWRRKDRGRAHPIRKRASHVIVEVDESP